MTKKIGINGFGRIGRQVLRSIFERYKGNIEVVGINDLFPAETNAHLLKYDSTYGNFPGEIKIKNGNLVVDGQEIYISSEREPGASWSCPSLSCALPCSFPLCVSGR